MKKLPKLIPIEKMKQLKQKDDEIYARRETFPEKTIRREMRLEDARCERQGKFLQEFFNCIDLEKAGKKTSVSRSTFLHWKNGDYYFCCRFNEVLTALYEEYD